MKIRLILNLGTFKIFPKSMEFETKFKDDAVPKLLQYHENLIKDQILFRNV